MSLEIHTTESEFESLRDRWNQLTDEPLRSFEWHHAWWRNYGGGGKLRIYGYRRDGELVGLLPLFRDRWLGQTRVRLIGGGHTCTDYAQILGDPRYHDEFAHLVVEDLTRVHRLDIIELEGVTPATFEPFRKSFEGLPYWNYQRLLDPTWVLPLPGSWPEFIAGRKKSLKRKIKRAESRLDSDDLAVQSTRDGYDFETAFEILKELHQDRFHSKGEPGVFADQRFTNFLETAARELAARQKCEIVVIHHDGEPLIAQIYLLYPTGPRLYQMGIRSAKMKMEPGHLLFTYRIRRAIAEGDTEFDFLRGNQPYKKFWGARPCPLLKVRMVTNRLFPTTANRCHQFLRKMKHLLENRPSPLSENISATV